MKPISRKRPQLGFKEFDELWKEKIFSSLYKKITEKNDLSFGSDKIISVANMYYKNDSHESNESYMKTYNVFKKGDIAFEGNKNKLFSYGRFVENTIGDGIVSHVFDVFRPVAEYDINYWNYAIHNEIVMRRVLRKSTTKATMMNNLVAKDFLKQLILVPSLKEQQKIGAFFKQLDELITLCQHQLDQLKVLKEGYLQKMFPRNGAKVPELRYKGFADDWEQHKFKDILKTHSFRSYLADASENGKYEVIQQGDEPIVGYSDGEPFTDYKDITLFGDHTVSLYKPKRPFFVATDGVKILSADNFEGDYLYTTLERYKPEPQGYKRHFTILKNQDVWFTGNMEEQSEIGTFFQQLDNLITLHQRKLDNLKKLKKAYLQKMFI